MFAQKLCYILVFSMLMCLLIESLPLEPKQFSDYDDYHEKFGYPIIEDRKEISQESKKVVEKTLYNFLCIGKHCTDPSSKTDPNASDCLEKFTPGCRPPNDLTAKK